MLKPALVLVLLAATAHAERVVALAPFSTLGAEDKSTGTKKLTSEVEQAIAAQPGTKVVTAAQVADAIGKAKKPQLKQCEGDAQCLAEVGKLVGANIVISGEVGGLGESKIVYLGATDVAGGRELRSTTLAIGGKDEGGGPSGAVVRLLDPDRYKGTLHFVIDVSGATIFVNGSKVTPAPNGDVSLPVGTQAVRVTQPEYHDFVRFVDVTYGKTTDVAVGLQQYPIVEHDVRAKPTNLDHIQYVDPPVWKRWYVWGGAAAVLAIGTGIVVGALAHDFPPFDNCRKVGGAGC